jgi:ABC-type Mn2+/Zn2+ transport system ATPase subunit
VLDEVSDTFKHIILTGKNGSGKTTILNRMLKLDTTKICKKLMR